MHAAHRGGPTETFQGRSRREFLRAGGLGLLGLELPTLLAAQSLSRSPQLPASTFGRAKACIILFMWGGPAQQDTWDLKPDAPEQFRGEFRPIATNVPGISISEHFPNLARQAHRLAIIRSVHHGDVNHTTATHELLTGKSIPTPGGGPIGDDWPHYGAVLARRDRGKERTSLPPFVQMRPTVPDGAPRFVESSHGQGAGWLGPTLNPFTIDDDPNRPDYHVGAIRLPDDVGSGRFGDRQRLLQTVEVQARHLERSAQIQALEAHYKRAYNLLTARRALEAFDLEREDPRIRARYGLHPHGQAVLQARRLVEAGVSLTTVFWQNDGLTNVSVYWDTHNRNFIDLKTRLMPASDQTFSALLDDLDARGLLDETLVIWTGEFGRTPRVGQGVVGGAGAGRDGRDHWPHCFTTVLAGAGIRGGIVHGASDRWAAHPARDPVTPSDIAATVYHLLGVDPALELADSLGRPLRLCSGTPIHGVLGRA
ncbi:DUF1501 domain-containing protein [Singulisphaera acidiphila]|uniref:DUF1501 domain-containing protein n=1 Tax=Singulisphaera acidiphila (strain ATCC BAA-1392 / DSM 18658 / VKM B-2454 / MOB10) TaxID=886293 RepID=L0D5S0_SINAD|nr:DUF1501 domain-containing protein [Singulisphaera acidiphila]AGA24607.1 hypothetical protein Sinac_0149 [Singulisphaera acidiphila DSM 18658]